MIREVKLSDSKQICEIYNYYIKETDITFEEIPLEIEEMEERIKEITLILPWFVFEEDGNILGYAYASKWKTRAAYKFSVESTVYVNKNLSHKGIGTKLYTELLKELKKRNIHAVIGGVALPNQKSCGLHEKLGFTKVAQFPEVGFKFGKWIDVGYWQINL